MKNHKFDSMSRTTPTTPCIVCGRPIDDPIHQIKPVDLNPSDEKLRETIAEKDGQIAQLRKISQVYSSQIWEKDAEIARLKHVNSCYYDCVGKKEANQRIAEEQEKALEIIKPMLAEKDAEIARLKIDRDNWKGRAVENNWPFEWQVAGEILAENKKLREEIQKLKTTDWAGVTETLTKKLVEKDQEIARLKAIIREGVEQEKANADKHRKESVPLMVAIAEKDQEIAQLKKDAERYQKLRRMLSPDNPDRFDESIDSANECSVKTEYYDPNYVSRSELARLLVHPLIEVANKDAERYRKLKAQRGAIHIYLESMTQLSLELPSRSFQPDNVDAAMDSLPEVQS